MAYASSWHKISVNLTMVVLIEIVSIRSTGIVKGRHEVLGVVGEVYTITAASSTRTTSAIVGVVKE